MQLNLPDGVSEEEFVDIVNNIANQLQDRFKFGYYTRDDIRQECFVKAIDALDRYDSNRPLPNFLYAHIRNRLCNLKRNKYFRLEKPCDKCPLNAYIPDEDKCTAYDNKLDCKLYALWYKKNNSKQNIMNPVGISIVNDENEKNMKGGQDISTEVAHSEILDIIDDNISISMRKYWLQQRGGVKIAKKYYDMLIEEISLILEDNNIDVSQTW